MGSTHETLRELAGIADEHARLIDFIDHYCRAADRGDSRGELVLLLEQVSDYARCHCREEEELMGRLAFPDLAAHRQDHHRLLGRITGLLLRLRASERPAIADTAALLRDWIVKHLRGPDAEFQTFLSRRFRGSAEPDV